MAEEEITALEALGIAIRDLIDAQDIYLDLASMTENDLIRDRFKNLYSEEKIHQKLLEEKYKEMFPNVDLMIPNSKLPKEAKESKRRKKMEIRDVLKLAIGEHKRSREFYLDCIESDIDPSGKRMFRFLADMKFSHQMILSVELEMLEKYPTYMEEVKGWNPESHLTLEKMKRRK